MARGKQIQLSDEFEELLKNITDDEKLGGVYLARPTGELLEEDNTFLEVIVANKSFYAKPCFGFGEWNAPNKEWLEKYKNEILIWVAFENGNSSHAVYMGIMPLHDKVPNLPYLRGKNYKSTEFSYYFDDTNKKYSLSKNDAEGELERGFEIDKNIVRILDSKGSILSVDSTTGQIEFKNWKNYGIKTTNTSIILGKDNGAESAIKGTTHIKNIQAILTTMATTPMIVNMATMTATFDPATISALTTQIQKLESDLSTQVKLD